MFDVTNSEVTEIQIWSLYNKKINKFVNNANTFIFHSLFKDDSVRLFESFVIKCDRDFNKFLTYLTSEQRNKILIHIVKIDL